MHEKLVVLHLSDLHIGHEKFDQKVVLDPLVQRVKEDSRNGLKPEIVVVSGDVAWSGIQAEYTQAETFLIELLDACGLERERLFMVPGNHDVNRKRYRPSDIPKYETMMDLNHELEEVDFRKDLFKGMEDYFAFCARFCPHLVPLDDNLVPFVDRHTMSGGKIVALVGLNSAWMCRQSPDDGKIALGEYQVKRAVEELKKRGPFDLALYLLHHPFSHLWREDQTICRRYIDGETAVVLCGHLHEPAGSSMEDLQGRWVQWQAGGAYLGSESEWPSRFHYLTLDWAANKMYMDFRAFDKENRNWYVDGKTGKDGHKEFDLFRPSSPVAATIPAKIPAAVFPPAYREWLIANYQHLDVEKLCGKEMVAPSLPEIFVPLYARVGKNRRQMENEAESPSAREENEPVELEKLLVKQRMLVIEGHPGSGKTTLMKHVAYCLAQAENPCAALKPLAGHLPLLLLLKDATAFFREMEKNGETCRSAWEIVAWMCANRTADILAGETVRAFAAQGRLVLLLDGLDELAAPFRDALVNHFADLLITHPDIHLVFTGRPHGLQAARLQARRVKIEALGEEQVADFVGKWFGYFYSGATGPGGRSADSLVAEMRAHPAVGELTDNPLMLTAVCILYHDQKELPGQRAELYKRFVDNMLYRRFGPECETVLGFLKTLAHGLHMRRRKSCDEHEALAALKEVYRQQERETAVEYEARVRGRFAAIESACGLLKLEAGGYEFWHLTFQEFLCADSICDNAADPRHAVDKYWDDPWLTEMVELYIGYLAMRNKGIAHAIVADALERENPRHWLKAAAALLDIPADRRDTQSVLPRARERLLALIGEENDLDRRELARAGELLGLIGDPRDLREFVAIEGGAYELEVLGRVSLAPFSVGKYPVTNGWYGEFVAAGGYRDPQHWSAAGRRWREVEHIELPKYWHDRSLNCPNAPVVGVSFWEAEAFANWWTAVAADGWIYYLPTQREWQAAAAGKEGRTFPWGNEADYSRCNCDEGEAVIGGPSTVGIFRRGATPQGVHDLAGNVWEWNQDEEENGDRVLRGGSWICNGRDVRSAFRGSIDPGLRGDGLGFRLARGHLVQTGQKR